MTKARCICLLCLQVLAYLRRFKVLSTGDSQQQPTSAAAGGRGGAASDDDDGSSEEEGVQVSRMFQYLSGTWKIYGHLDVLLVAGL
jgi:hypothetical protein